MAYILVAEGIPIVYYGSEQYYRGTKDPNNREPLWTDMDTSSDAYVFISKVNKIRKQMQVWNF